MRKKIISAFLAIVMIVCIMPFGSKNAYAADELPWSDLLLDAEKWFNISCDITVENEQKINVKSDSATNEEYTLLKKPDSDSALVVGQEKQVLQAVPFDILVNHIDNCVELIHILRNVVSGVGLSSKLTALNDRFSPTLDTTLVLLYGFKSSLDVTISDNIQAYKYNTDPLYVNAGTNGVAMANKTIGKIQVRYDSLASQVEDLIRRYDSNEETVNDTLDRVMDYLDLDAEKKKEVHSELDGIMKKIDCLKEQKSALCDKINEYSKKYTDFSYQFPGQEQLLTKDAAISSIYGGAAYLFGLPQDDVAIILEEQKAVQTAYSDVLQEMVSLTDKIANSSASTRDVNVVLNAFLATCCCIKLIEVYLCDLSVFCKNVSESCQTMIDRYAAVAQVYANSDDVSYVNVFKDEKYIEAYLLYVADLTALNRLSLESLNTFLNSREKNETYEKEEGTVPQTHFERAINSALALSVKMKEMNNQSLYSGTVINEQSSGSMTIVAVCGVAILCGTVGALIAAKRKKNSVLDSSIEKGRKNKE